MKIKKKLNNNVVIATNEMNTEFVLSGKGIAFDKKPGDNIDSSVAEKIFSTKEKGVAEKLSQIIEEIPIEHVKVCDEIINMAKNRLQDELNEKIYLTLIDHISFAIERHQAGFDISSLLKWEIKKIAPKEYEVGLEALDIVEKRLNIRLPNDEAVYIAFHFINSRVKDDGFSEQSIDLTRHVLRTITDSYTIDTNEDSVSYNRFIIHLQYLARRIFKSEEVPKNNGQEKSLFEKLKLELSDSYECVCKIEECILREYDFKLSENEKTYLMIHLHNLISK
jgi:beta-glucoside operon transcriptional antiterminator